MRLTTIPAYLAGKRWAILELTGDRGALPVAGLLVLSAAIARNYDRASLLNEPWRLAGPFVASLAISGPLFLVIYFFARCKGMESPGIGQAYLSFLTLYWMTAPLAWLYGIPYEMFDTPLDATNANLRTLALVSVWRVALMTRVVAVLFRLPVRFALALVMLVADSVALVALHLVPLPVVNVMGGIPLQQQIALAAFLVRVLCWLTLPIWIVLVLAAMRSSRLRPRWESDKPTEQQAVSALPLGLALLILLAWASLLPFTQPAQRLAYQVDRVYRNQGIVAAQALISKHQRSDFPTDWQPPPWSLTSDVPSNEVLDALEAIADHRPAEWVGAIYVERVQDQLQYDHFYRQDLVSQHLVRLAPVLSRLPQGPVIARRLESYLDAPRFVRTDDPNEGPARTRAVETLKRLAAEGVYRKSPQP
jgi:hypothetical protein